MSSYEGPPKAAKRHSTASLNRTSTGLTEMLIEQFLEGEEVSFFALETWLVAALTLALLRRERA